LSRQRHSTVIQRVLTYVSKQGWRLFKNAVGSGWAGKLVEDYMYSSPRKQIIDGVAIYSDGGRRKAVTLNNAQHITYGLRPGSSDLIGWRTVKIRPEDVDKRIAQFCAVECKTGQYATITTEQSNFLQQVRKAGGYAAVAQLNGEKVILKEVRKDE